MKILVCGGRDFAFNDDYAARFHDVVGRHGATAIIHGGARGADHGAGRLARGRGLHVDVYAADWRAHGPAAGPIRNQRMLDEGKPGLVVAFPGGRGTADMVRRAHAAGVPVEVVA